MELFDDIEFSNNSTTLAEARTFIESHASDGVLCPACTQHVKVYRRPLNRGMARALIRLWRIAKTRPVHLSRTVSAISHEAAQLSWWNLIEPAQVKGFWSVTQLGRQFVLDGLEVSRHAYVFNGKLLGYDDTQRVSISDILGDEYRHDMTLRA